jgi:hypothetical protein
MTILMALSDIATQQAAPTENTKKQVNQFLDYMWTHPDARIHYCASKIILLCLQLRRRLFLPGQLTSRW